MVTFSPSRFTEDRPTLVSPKAIPYSIILSDADMLRLDYIPRLESHMLSARLVMMSAHTVLQYIPARIGGSTALDDAVRCIMSAPLRLGEPDDGPQRYLKALQSLQFALQDGVSARRPETLAAVALLHMYELFVNEAGQGWVSHAQGAIRMLQLRGPSHVKDDIEKAILYAESGNIFMSALEAKAPCFLADPTWSSVLEAAAQPNSGAGVISPMIVLGIHLPGLLQGYGNIVHEANVYNGHEPELTELQVQIVGRELVIDVLVQLNSLRARLRNKWYDIEAADNTTTGDIILLCFVVMINCMLAHVHYISDLSAERSCDSAATLPTMFKLTQETYSALESVKLYFCVLKARDCKVATSLSTAIRRILCVVIEQGPDGGNLEVMKIREPLFMLSDTMKGLAEYTS